MSSIVEPRSDGGLLGRGGGDLCGELWGDPGGDLGMWCTAIGAEMTGRGRGASLSLDRPLFFITSLRRNHMMGKARSKDRTTTIGTHGTAFFPGVFVGGEVDDEVSEVDEEIGEVVVEGLWLPV